MESRKQQNIWSRILRGSAVVHILRTIGGIPQARRLCGIQLVMIQETLDSYKNITRRRSVVGGKSGKYTPNESRTDLEENLRGNHYALWIVDGNSSNWLKRRSIEHLILFNTHLQSRLLSRETTMCVAIRWLIPSTNSDFIVEKKFNVLRADTQRGVLLSLWYSKL